MDKELKEYELTKWARERGFARPMQKDNADYLGEFFMYSTENGGRQNPVTHTYSPQHYIDEKYSTSGLMRFINVDVVWPGDKAEVYATLLSPEAYNKALHVGDVIGLYEGSHKIGEVKLIEIYNSDMACDR